MSDEPSMHIGDPMRVAMTDGAQPEEIAIASGRDGALWCAMRASAANGESTLVVQRSDRTDARVIAPASRLGGIAVADHAVWIAYRDATGHAAIVSTSTDNGSTRIDRLDASDEPPRIAIDPANGDVILWRSERNAALPRGVRSLELDAPPNARDADLAVGAEAVGLTYVNDRVVEVVDSTGTHRFDPLSSRARAHAPCVIRVAGRWAAAWVSDDTGKLVMARSIVGETSARVAEVWCALTRPWASAPALVGDATGAWIAWREERGPRAGVYLRRLDAELRQVAREARISDRAAVAAPGRVAMTALRDGTVAVAWIESRDGVREAWVRTVALTMNRDPSIAGE